VFSLPESLHTLKNRNYQKIFSASLTSNVGSWVETVVIGIFVQQLTGSASLVGIVFAMRYGSNVFISPFGGWCADRFNRKRLLMLTNFISSLIAISIGILVSHGSVKYWMLIFFVGTTGIMDAIGHPTYQAFLSELVPKKIYSGAMSLMFSQWNMARIIGPAIAALLVRNDNYEFAFYVNAVSFWAVIITLFSIRSLPHKRDTGIKTTWVDGLNWVFKEQKLARVVATHSASVFFAGGLIAVIPNVADEVFHSRVFGTSMLNISMAIGAILITIFYTTIANKYGKNKTLAILARFVPLTVLAFGFAPNLLIGCLVIAFFGITHMGTLTGIITEIQLLAPPDLKGKVSSVFSAILGTFLLLATLTYGYLIDAFDARFAFSVIAIGHVTVQLVIGLYSHKWGIRATYNIIEDDVKVVVPEVEDISPLIDL
jgi:MFS family permease